MVETSSLPQLLSLAQSHISEVLVNFTMVAPGGAVDAEMVKILVEDAQDDLARAAKFLK